MARLALADIAQIARIQAVHAKHMIYRDIKPDKCVSIRAPTLAPDRPPSFMFGPVGGRRASVIYLIGAPHALVNRYCPPNRRTDFGLATLYRDPQTRQHVRYKENQPLEGTARYLSVNAHRGIRTSRRDDLESIMYVLIYMCKVCSGRSRCARGSLTRAHRASCRGRASRAPLTRTSASVSLPSGRHPDSVQVPQNR
jgi:serine/threonine protein kinase